MIGRTEVTGLGPYDIVRLNLSFSPDSKEIDN